MNTENKANGVVSFCKDIFKCSPSEKRLLVWLIIVIIFSAGITYVKFTNIIPKVEKNSADVEALKGDFREVKVKQEYFNEKQTVMHADVKEIQRDIKLLLRR